MEKQELYDMCKSIIELHKQRYTIVKSEIEKIIRDNVKDERYIQRKLDEMLDILLFYENDDSLLLFGRLCKYYFSINPMVTAQYITYYREHSDPEGIKFGNKVEIKVKEEETKWTGNLQLIINYLRKIKLK